VSLLWRPQIAAKRHREQPRPHLSSRSNQGDQLARCGEDSSIQGRQGSPRLPVARAVRVGLGRFWPTPRPRAPNQVLVQPCVVGRSTRASCTPGQSVSAARSECRCQDFVGILFGMLQATWPGSTAHTLRPGPRNLTRGPASSDRSVPPSHLRWKSPVATCGGVEVSAADSIKGGDWNHLSRPGDCL